MPCTRARRHDDDWGIVEKRARHQLLDLEPDDVEHAGVGEIGLRDDDETGGHVKQAADLEVLARLRHHRLVSGDMEHDEVHATDAGQHVADEAFVTRDVDEGEDGFLFGGVGKAEVDRDAALFLLAQPIGIGAGQRQDQRALAVIDVTCSADDDVLHQVKCPRGNISS